MTHLTHSSTFQGKGGGYNQYFDDDDYSNYDTGYGGSYSNYYSGGKGKVRTVAVIGSISIGNKLKRISLIVSPLFQTTLLLFYSRAKVEDTIRTLPTGKVTAKEGTCVDYKNSFTKRRKAKIKSIPMDSYYS
jgi:hypothetical protein